MHSHQHTMQRGNRMHATGARASSMHFGRPQQPLATFVSPYWTTRHPYVSRPPGDPQLNSTVDVVKDEEAWALAGYWMREGTLEADRWR